MPVRYLSEKNPNLDDHELSGIFVENDRSMCLCPFFHYALVICPHTSSVIITAYDTTIKELCRLTMAYLNLQRIAAQENILGKRKVSHGNINFAHLFSMNIN